MVAEVRIEDLGNNRHMGDKHRAIMANHKDSMDKLRAMEDKIKDMEDKDTEDKISSIMDQTMVDNSTMVPNKFMVVKQTKSKESIATLVKCHLTLKRRYIATKSKLMAGRIHTKSQWAFKKEDIKGT